MDRTVCVHIVHSAHIPGHSHTSLSLRVSYSLTESAFWRNDDFCEHPQHLLLVVTLSKTDVRRKLFDRASVSAVVCLLSVRLDSLNLPFCLQSLFKPLSTP